MTTAPQITALDVQEFIHEKVAKSPIYKFTLSDLVVKSVSKSAVRCRLVLTENHLNSHGSIHGSVSATIVDFAGGMAIFAHDGRSETGLSADIHVTYISGARRGDEVEIEARVDRVGSALAFTTVRIWKIVPGHESENGDEPGPLVITSTHTKYVGRSKKPLPATAA